MATDRHQAPSYPLRMPEELKERIQAAAEKAGRSLHAELLQRLQNSFETDSSFQMLYELRRTQLQLELNTVAGLLQKLFFEDRRISQLISELQIAGAPVEEIQEQHDLLAANRSEQAKLKSREMHAIHQTLKLDDEHSDRFDLWEK